jgi:sigma-B regulation protein RsbU (phosphoserine phosphatase)
VNKLFHESTPIEQYASVFFARYDDRTRHLRYVNCGHHAPILVRRNGIVERLASTATVVGMFKDWSCVEREIELAAGDTLILFSDGVIEAGQPVSFEDSQEFGEDRVISIIQGSRNQQIDVVIDRILEGVRGFNLVEQADDFTVVGIRGIA